MDDDERFNLNTNTVDDVMDVIQFSGIDKDGLHWMDWYKRIQSGDALYNITMILVRNRKDPHFAELIDQLDAEIEGWLP
jgi:hypothetical protein